MITASAPGALPPGADAVIMVEHVEELDETTLEVLRAVAPFDHVVRKGEDFKAGEKLLKSGQRLRPQDLGLLAAMGKQEIAVYKKPTVAIISSGDEIVPIDQDPPPGCVRDVNRYTLTSMIWEAHALPKWIGIAPDTLNELGALLKTGMERSDVVVISGGSSMGSRDHVIEAIRKHPDSEILLHGVSVSPGKPLILARIGNTPVVGLPGHPVSAMVCFDQFVVPIIRRLEGEDIANPFLRPNLWATLGRNLPSKEGRTDFVRVRLHEKDGKIIAVPVPGKSGTISAMVHAHGFVRIEADCEGLYRGDRVVVHLYANWIGGNLETQYLSGHEGAAGSIGDIPEASEQEKLSGI
jgi:molybdopterin molybdotransferase